MLGVVDCRGLVRDSCRVELLGLSATVASVLCVAEFTFDGAAQTRAVALHDVVLGPSPHHFDGRVFSKRT